MIKPHLKGSSGVQSPARGVPQWAVYGFGGLRAATHSWGLWGMREGGNFEEKNWLLGAGFDSPHSYCPKGLGESKNGEFRLRCMWQP